MHSAHKSVRKLRDSARSLLAACKVHVIVGSFKGGRSIVIGRYDDRSQATEVIVQLMSHADPGWRFTIE